MEPPWRKISAGRFSPDFKPAGTKSCAWSSRPSADLKMACCGTTNPSDGKPLGQVSGATGGFDLAPKSLMTILAGKVAPEARKAKVCPSLSITELHSIPLPRVHCSGRSPLSPTLQRCRRSMSLQFELKRTVFLSGVNDHCSTSQSPGVSSFGFPPSAESAYRCCQPSSSDAITS